MTRTYTKKNTRPGTCSNRSAFSGKGVRKPANVVSGGTLSRRRGTVPPAHWGVQMDRSSSRNGLTHDGGDDDGDVVLVR